MELSHHSLSCHTVQIKIISLRNSLLKQCREHPWSTTTNLCQSAVKDGRREKQGGEHDEDETEVDRGETVGSGRQRWRQKEVISDKETARAKGTKVNIWQTHVTCDHRTLPPSCLKDMFFPWCRREYYTGLVLPFTNKWTPLLYFCTHLLNGEFSCTEPQWLSTGSSTTTLGKREVDQPSQ